MGQSPTVPLESVSASRISPSFTITTRYAALCHPSTIEAYQAKTSTILPSHLPTRNASKLPHTPHLICTYLLTSFPR